MTENQTNYSSGVRALFAGDTSPSRSASANVNVGSFVAPTTSNNISYASCQRAIQTGKIPQRNALLPCPPSLSFRVHFGPEPTFLVWYELLSDPRIRQIHILLQKKEHLSIDYSTTSEATWRFLRNCTFTFHSFNVDWWHRIEFFYSARPRDNSLYHSEISRSANISKRSLSDSSTTVIRESTFCPDIEMPFFIRKCWPKDRQAYQFA